MTEREQRVVAAGRTAREVLTFKAEDKREGFSAAELVELLTPAVNGGYTMRVTPNMRGRVVRLELTRATGRGAR